jgi:hypothetical protein
VFKNNKYLLIISIFFASTFQSLIIQANTNAQSSYEIPSYSLKELFNLSKKVDNEWNKLCTDPSNTYLKLPLKRVDPVLRPCVSDLLKHTTVPPLFPPTIPKYLSPDARKHYAYTIPDKNKKRYTVGLTWSPREYYQANVAYFSGEELTSELPNLLAYYNKEVSFLREASQKKETYSRFRDAYRESGSVKLTNGIDGYYIDAVCGANCHGAYSRVIWQQNNYIYKIAIKLGHKKDVIETANEAINNQR